MSRLCSWDKLCIPSTSALLSHTLCQTHWLVLLLISLVTFGKPIPPFIYNSFSPQVFNSPCFLLLRTLTYDYLINVYHLQRTVISRGQWSYSIYTSHCIPNAWQSSWDIVFNKYLLNK